MLCFSCDEILSLGYIRIDLKLLAPLKITSKLICQTNFCQFLTETRNIGNGDEEIFLDF